MSWPPASNGPISCAVKNLSLPICANTRWQNAPISFFSRKTARRLACSTMNFPRTYFILDLQMPKKDDPEVIRDLMTRIPKPWIIVMTSYESEQDIRQALSAGAEAFLVKGTGPQQIREAVTKRRQPEPDNRCLKRKV
jgi:CheY-like chemotaxis protein